MASQHSCRPPSTPNQGTDRKGVPLPEVQEAEPPGGFQGRALRLAEVQAIALRDYPWTIRGLFRGGSLRYRGAFDFEVTGDA